MRIGIVSLYYNNRNYGGQLQAYALTKYLNELGFETEQICIDASVPYMNSIIARNFSPMRPSLKNRSILLSKTFIRKILKIIMPKFRTLPPLDKQKLLNIELRNGTIKEFEQTIPHSHQIYNDNNIANANSIYDAFIVGSDQVWNLKWYRPAFFLEFADKTKKKISYAASMPNINMMPRQQHHIKEILSKFSGISVREDISAHFLSQVLNKNVKKVLDPTLLLDREQWDEIATERIINEKYIFCYFFGGGISKRQLAQDYADKYGYKLVTLPYLLYKHRDDECFGDYQLYEISPKDFISLIKYSEFVFTDSFHAAVFSNIYKKEFCVIDRNNKNEEYMQSRLISLFDMLSERDRLIDDKCTVDDINKLKKIDYVFAHNIIKQEQKNSLQFLLNSLND